MEGLSSQDGKVDSTDLDQYVDFCTQNAIRPEFRFLTGYQPKWMKDKLVNDQKDLILRHAKDLAQRYGTKITDWQVTSEDVGLKEIGMMEYDAKTKPPKLPPSSPTSARSFPTAA